MRENQLREEKQEGEDEGERGEEGEEEVNKDKRGQIYGDGRKFDFG